MAASCRGGAPLSPPLATYLRDTDRILSISILRFSTSFTRPLSGPCLTFSRPIKYKHFGVRSKSRFTLCKDRCFRKCQSVPHSWRPAEAGRTAVVNNTQFPRADGLVLCFNSPPPQKKKKESVRVTVVYTQGLGDQVKGSRFRQWTFTTIGCWFPLSSKSFESKRTCCLWLLGWHIQNCWYLTLFNL